MASATTVSLPDVAAAKSDQQKQQQQQQQQERQQQLPRKGSSGIACAMASGSASWK